MGHRDDLAGLDFQRDQHTGFREFKRVFIKITLGQLFTVGFIPPGIKHLLFLVGTGRMDVGGNCLLRRALGSGIDGQLNVIAVFRLLPFNLSG
ncbi:hypothetical protein SDC9_115017 [bioreactor metagenome]|uniref:Uncharacterized protein n=1 Tax=bioreactor metagenome TaxID=1076179 RepID=A0A645BRU3_9ZZZZ